MTENKTGIKNIKDIILAVEVLTIDSIKAFGDGFDIEDLSVLTKSWPTMSEAIKDCKKIREEAKDLSDAEIQELVAIAVGLVFKIKRAIKDLEK